MILIDAVFTDAAGKTACVPAFWKQDFTRTLVEGKEQLQPAGEPGWRVRHTPWVPGALRCELWLGRDGAKPSPAGTSTVEVLPPSAPTHGYLRVEPEKKRFFQYGDGTPAPLLGSNLCWPGARGTYDYDDWMTAFAGAGMNFTRLWMWPLSFGIEVSPGERLNYSQSQAWRLDHVMALAAEKGVVVMLCMDFHGMFQDTKDMWGGNDYWPTHPYNQTQGGPCATQNDFFTNSEARRLYEKRLRYMVGRYGAYPSLLSWEFFNEINNVYGRLKKADVVQWHADMARVLHGMDPFGHPVTTSFSGTFEDHRMWELPEMDFTQYHLYCDGVRKDLGRYIERISRRFAERYGRPLVYGEFGATYKGDGRDIDPHDRCLRQGIWAGLLSGSAGTVMPWWWEGLNTNNRHAVWASAAQFIRDTGFGLSSWRPAEVFAPPEPGVTALAMTDGRTALAYLIDRRYEYPAGATDAGPVSCKTRVRLKGLADGAYEVTWWDPAGTALRGETERCRDGVLELGASFDVDTAVRIRPAKEP